MVPTESHDFQSHVLAYAMMGSLTPWMCMMGTLRTGSQDFGATGIVPANEAIAAKRSLIWHASS